MLLYMKCWWLGARHCRSVAARCFIDLHLEVYARASPWFSCTTWCIRRRQALIHQRCCTHRWHSCLLIRICGQHTIGRPWVVWGCLTFASKCTSWEDRSFYRRRDKCLWLCPVPWSQLPWDCTESWPSDWESLPRWRSYFYGFCSNSGPSATLETFAPRSSNSGLLVRRSGAC